MKRNVFLALSIFVLPVIASAEDAAGKQIATGTSNAVVGVVDGTRDAVGTVASGTEQVVTGTAGVVASGTRTVMNEVTGDPINSNTKADLTAKVNCDTAKQDIVTLEKEKASTTDQVKNGVKSVLPVTAVVRLLSGTYTDGVSVAAGQYNQDIDGKIASIRGTCNVH